MMETEWTCADKVWFLDVLNVRDGYFLGAYFPEDNRVVSRTNLALATLPDDLTLDEALSAAKVIILAHGENYGS